MDIKGETIPKLPKSDKSWFLLKHRWNKCDFKTVTQARQIVWCGLGFLILYVFIDQWCDSNHQR